MSPIKSQQAMRYCLITSTIALVTIAFELIPISRHSAYWNRCLDNTVLWINQSSRLTGLKKLEKESLAVAVCNGAVHEPKLRNND
ncbi:hypothetical protein [Prochlorococcus sp. MIT 1223]|uniref:hypothetical protein n=1 Tax=Prochlorococcus sp. MIT 1223 TaxID=3096217 RepID=UPI002A751CE7|nr:hypothetical protein [Prochlorococcus sp. MIT 1223]